MTPDVAEQESPEGAQSAFMAQGVGQPQPAMEQIQQLLQSLAKFEPFFDSTVQQTKAIDPQLVPMLQPIAQALLKLRTEIQKRAQRSGAAQGSPVMPQMPQGNPGAGPPQPSEM
jgi:hypothetical protein